MNNIADLKPATSRILLWTVWFVGVLSFAIAVINRTSLSTLGVVAQKHFGIEATGLASFVVLQIAVFAVLQIPVGVLLDRFGATVMITAGVLLMGVAQLIMAMVDTLPFALAARALLGAGDACIFVSLMRMVQLWFPPKRVPTMSQLSGFLGQCGQLVSITPLALLVAASGWFVGFTTLAVATGFVLLACVLVLRDQPGEHSLPSRLFGRRSETANPLTGGASVAQGGSVMTALGELHPVTEAIPVIGPNSSGMLRAMRDLWRRPGIRLAFWLHLATAGGFHAFLLLWGYPFLYGGMQVPPTEAKAIMSLLLLAGVVCGLALGPVTSRYAMQRVYIALFWTIIVSVLWAVVLFMPVVAPVWLLAVATFVLGFGGPFSLIAFDVVRTHAPHRQTGLATGLVNTGGYSSA
ncbi:MAG: MFS transporter [Microbacteriaceae bacterium]|nr:MFS transporter [Microbacteriaceae bacterium]